MSITIRPFKRGGWEVDIRIVSPDGSRTLRERRRAPVASKFAAARWAEGRERILFDRLMNPASMPERKKEVPTLEQFTPRFLDGHARANQHKASGIAAKAVILRVHLGPRLGHKKLDAITTEDVQGLKAQLQHKSPKTVNNVLTVLNTLLRKAVEWGVIAEARCTIRLLKVAKSPVAFYDFDEYERLVSAAQLVSTQAYLVVLLGGEAGLRSGEMVALEWDDIDLPKRLLCVQRNAWEGHVDSPKGGRIRYVRMTMRLTAALREARHLRGRRVLYRDDGRPYSEMSTTLAVKRAARKAGLEANGPHRLRHTFCSHLAMRGAAPRAIQQLAGHAHFTTTQRYMHLSPAALDAAIDLLERPRLNEMKGGLEHA